MRRPLAFLLLATVTAASARAQGNVLLIVADDLGVDRVAAYDEHLDPGRTPNIDRLAAAGILFRNAWSHPVCSPSRAAMLTGRYPFRTLIGKNVHPKGDKAIGLNLTELTIPELLGPGYGNGALGKWHLSVSSDGFDHPRKQGFETFAGAIWNFGGTKSNYFRFYKIVNGRRTGSLVYETTSTTNDAIREIETLPEPWFLYVSYHAPHAPVHVPPDDLHSFTLSGDPDDSPVIHTKAMIEALDTEVGRLLGHVDYETTTIMFLGDNGTGKDASEAPFLPEHAKGTLYEGGINIPLIVAGASAVPGVQVAPGECAALVHLVDIFATVAELSGFANTSEDSVSMVPYFQGDHTPRREFVYSELFKPNGPGPYNEYNRTVRGLRYKLIRRLDGEELYDLEADPFEERDLLQRPLLTSEQRAAYEALDAELARIRAS